MGFGRSPFADRAIQARNGSRGPAWSEMVIPRSVPPVLDRPSGDSGGASYLAVIQPGIDERLDMT